MIKVILLSIGLVSLAFLSFGVKVLFKKNGKFSGTCAGGSELFKREGASCSVCGATSEEECKNKIED